MTKIKRDITIHSTPEDSFEALVNWSRLAGRLLGRSPRPALRRAP
jgi:hypothetical protein